MRRRYFCSASERISETTQGKKGRKQTFFAAFSVFCSFLSPLRVFLLISRRWCKARTSGACKICIRNEIKTRVRTHILHFIITITPLLVTPEEEMNGSALYFHDRMKTAERNNGHWLRVRPTRGSIRALTVVQRIYSPYPLPPQLFCQNNSPHGVFAIICCTIARRTSHCPQLPFITLYFSLHPALNHSKEHSLHSTIKLVVLRSDVCTANVG